MKVTQEKLPGSQVNLTIELPANLTQSAYEKSLQKLSKQIRVSGFRPGKVPRKVLIQQLGMPRIKAHAIESLLEQNVSKAFKEADVRPIGQYDIRPSFEVLVGKFEPNQPLSFAVVVDVVPSVTLHQYKGLALQAETVPYDPAQVDDVIAHYRKQSSTLLPVEDNRPAQMGDVAVLDYEGFFLLPQDAPEGTEPAPIPEAKGSDAQVDLEEGNFIPGFIEGVIGMTPGESRDVSATFPNDYPVADLAGKPVVFQVTLKELKIRELPNLDDDFAQQISQYDSYDALRAGLETRYQREAADRERNNKIHACVQKLVENVEAEFPKTLVDEQCDILMRQMLNQFSQQGIDLRKLDDSFAGKLRQAVEPEAIDELKKNFGLLQLAKLEGIKAEEDAVKERMSQILSAIDNPKKVDMNRLKTIAEDEVMQELCLQWLLENNTIEMVPPGTLAPDDEMEENNLEDVEVAEVEETEDVEVEAANVETEDVEAAEVEAADVVEAETAETETAEVETADVEAGAADVEETEATVEVTATTEQ